MPENLYEDGGTVKIGAALFEFPPLPELSEWSTDRARKAREDTVKARRYALTYAPMVEGGRIPPGARTNPDAKRTRTREDYEADAIAYAIWLAARDGVSLVDRQGCRDEGRCEWRRAPLTAGTVARKAKRGPQYREYIDAIAAVSFGAVKIPIPGWDAAAMPVAEGPVTFLRDFAEREKRARRIAHDLARFQRLCQDVPEAAEIPTGERFGATLDRLEETALQRSAARSRMEEAAETFEHQVFGECDYLQPGAGPLYDLARADTDDQLETALYAVTLRRLWLRSGVEANRPLADDPRLPSLGRAKRKALVSYVSSRYQEADHAYWVSPIIAAVKLPWSMPAPSCPGMRRQDYPTVAEWLFVREHPKGDRWAFLRYRLDSFGNRFLADMSETTSVQVLAGWCAALAAAIQSPLGIGSLADDWAEKLDCKRTSDTPELLDRACWAVIQAGHFVIAMGQADEARAAKTAAVKAGKSDLCLVMLGDGWATGEDAGQWSFRSNAVRFCRGERQRVSTSDLERRRLALTTPDCRDGRPSVDWLSARFGADRWCLVGSPRSLRRSAGQRIGIPRDAYRAAIAEARTVEATSAGDQALPTAA